MRFLIDPHVNRDNDAGIDFGFIYMNSTNADEMFRFSDQGTDYALEEALDDDVKSAQACLRGEAEWNEHDWSREQVEYLEDEDPGDAAGLRSLIAELRYEYWDTDKIHVEDVEGYTLILDYNNNEIVVAKSPWVAYVGPCMLNGGWLADPREQDADGVWAYALSEDWYDEWNPAPGPVISIAGHLDRMANQ